MMVLAMVCMAVVVSAQDVVGTWFAAEEDNSMAMSIVFALNENLSGDMGIQVAIPQEAEGVQMVINIKSNVPLKWSVKKDVVTIKMTKNGKPTLDIDIDLPGIDEETASLVKAMIEKEVKGMQKELEKELLKGLTGEKLEMTIGHDNGETVLIMDKDTILHRK